MISLETKNEKTDSTETDKEISEKESCTDADDCCDDEVLAVGQESENDDETVFTRSGRKAGGFSTVSDLF